MVYYKLHRNNYFLYVWKWISSFPHSSLFVSHGPFLAITSCTTFRPRLLSSSPFPPVSSRRHFVKRVNYSQLCVSIPPSTLHFSSFLLSPRLSRFASFVAADHHYHRHHYHHPTTYVCTHWEACRRDFRRKDFSRLVALIKTWKRGNVVEKRGRGERERCSCSLKHGARDM